LCKLSATLSLVQINAKLCKIILLVHSINKAIFFLYLIDEAKRIIIWNKFRLYICLLLFLQFLSNFSTYITAIRRQIYSSFLDTLQIALLKELPISD